MQTSMVFSSIRKQKSLKRLQITTRPTNGIFAPNHIFHVLKNSMISLVSLRAKYSARSDTNLVKLMIDIAT